MPPERLPAFFASPVETKGRLRKLIEVAAARDFVQAELVVRVVTIRTIERQTLKCFALRYYGNHRNAGIPDLVAGIALWKR